MVEISFFDTKMTENSEGDGLSKFKISSTFEEVMQLMHCQVKEELWLVAKS